MVRELYVLLLVHHYMECCACADLAGEVLSKQDVASSQVSVHKALAGEVAHAFCYVLGELDELLRQPVWKLLLIISASGIIIMYVDLTILCKAPVSAL